MGKKLNLGGLSAASRVEGRRRNDAFNASIRQFIETIQVENNTVTFTVPEQWQQDYAAWQVDPVTATCADGTTVTLTLEQPKHKGKKPAAPKPAPKPAAPDTTTAKPGAKPEAKPQKPETKPKNKAEAKPKAKSENKPKAKPTEQKKKKKS